MESHFADKPPARLFYNIIAGLRTRYGSLNNPPLNKVPMLNSPVVDDTVGLRFLGKVLTRLRDSRATAERGVMDLNFPRPMLNSPVDNDIVGSRFLGKVLHRFAESNESRRAVIETAHICERRNEPDYVEIVRPIDTDDPGTFVLIDDPD